MNTGQADRAAAEREIYHNNRTYDEHRVWLDAMSPDEKLIIGAPVGWRYTLIVISIAKRALAAETTTEVRLRFLEVLDNVSEAWPPEIIGGVAPMSDQAAEIWGEAQKLGTGKALNKCAEFDVFTAFCALNPSLLEALRMRENLPVYRRSTT